MAALRETLDPRQADLTEYSPARMGAVRPASGTICNHLCKAFTLPGVRRDMLACIRKLLRYRNLWKVFTIGRGLAYRVHNTAPGRALRA